MKLCDSILVGSVGPTAWVRIDGTANHENSGGIQDFLLDQYEDGCRRFVVDLEMCRCIDSTFIGMIYQLAVKVSEENGGGLEVIDANERNVNSIRKLGLDWAIKLGNSDGALEPERTLLKEEVGRPIVCKEMGKRERAERILNAHEALLESSEENENRFRDVVDLMRQEIEDDSEGN